jgi:hypothetical protein
VASQEPPRKLISQPSSLLNLLPDLSELQICGHTCPNTQQNSVCLLAVNINIIIIFAGDINTKVHSEVCSSLWSLCAAKCFEFARDVSGIGAAFTEVECMSFCGSPSTTLRALQPHNECFIILIVSLP